MKSRFNKHCLVLAVAAATLQGSPAALAQTASAQALEEVVVTARKRSESVQDVPLAIDAIDSDRIAQLDITSTQDVARYTPALRCPGVKGDMLADAIARADLKLCWLAVKETSLPSPP